MKAKRLRFEIFIDGKFYAFDPNYNVAANLTKVLMKKGKNVQFYRVENGKAERLI